MEKDMTKGRPLPVILKFMLPLITQKTLREQIAKRILKKQD